jgi:2-dehydro-3-deoxyphosphogluconate aldolase/(4S)-4-hydroxy-2-oxoglutarate aldolase
MTAPLRAIAGPPIPGPILAGRIVAIARGIPAERLPAVATALRDGGVRAFEVTLDSPGALAGIAAVAAAEAAAGASGLLVGAGTVLDRGAAAAALEAGATFLVMPHTDPDLVGWAAERGVAAFPGAMTPSEILAAWRAGAAAVKVFPASALGPSFLREVRGPLGAIPLVPTGGITGDNAAAFLAAGAAAVGVGGWLTGSGDPHLVGERAAALVAAIAGSGGPG